METSFDHLESGRPSEMKVKVAQTEPLPKDSFLRIPLVTQLLNDPNVQVVARAVDTAWADKGLVRKSVTGFSPIHSKVFYGAQGPVAKWLQDPINQGRKLNENDVLAKQILFLLHDYLHVWAYYTLRGNFPELGIAQEPISDENIEKFCFIHLLTEAVATVGLDYWYLSVVDLNDVVDIGTLQGPLTVSYRQSDWELEYKNLCPDLKVQDPNFLKILTRAYCTGAWSDFSMAHVFGSPKLKKWLSHEMSYGGVQRRVSREWLGALSEGRVSVDSDKLARPVTLEEPWQAEILEAISQKLWEKVRGNQFTTEKISLPPITWQAPVPKVLDFRYVNAQKVEADYLTAHDVNRIHDTNFEYYASQVVSQYGEAECRSVVKNSLPYILETRDPELLHFIFRKEKKMTPVCDDPDVMIFAS